MAWQEVIPGSKVWVYEYLANGYKANSMAVLLNEHDLAIISPPVGSSEADFAALDGKGQVTALIAPHAGHDLGQAEWQARYPAAIPYASDAALGRLKTFVRPFVPLSRLSAPQVEFHEIPGTSIGDMIATAHHGERPVVYLGETVINWASLPKTRGRLAFWLTRSAPGLHLNRVYTRGLCPDPQRMAKSILKALEGDPVIVLAHGAPLVQGDDPGRVRALVVPLEEAVTWVNSGWRGWRIRIQKKKEKRNALGN
jgi:hypothetical protein